MSNFQRIGSISNAHVGRDFEATAMSVLKNAGFTVEQDFSVEVGVDQAKKSHCFDLGAESPAVLVECKSHKWTSGGNVPSAKMTVWNEAMYYFAVAPAHYKKILFVLHDTRAKSGETLAEYYFRRHRHLVPQNVEIWEYDPKKHTVRIHGVG